MQIGFQRECVCVGQLGGAVEIESRQQFHITYASCVSVQDLLHPARRLLQTLRSKKAARVKNQTRGFARMTAKFSRVVVIETPVH